MKKELADRDLLADDEDAGPLIAFPNDSFYLRSIGSVVHDFCLAVEKVVLAVARSLDGVLPEERQLRCWLLL